MRFSLHKAQMYRKQKKWVCIVYIFITRKLYLSELESRLVNSVEREPSFGVVRKVSALVKRPRIEEKPTLSFFDATFSSFGGLKKKGVEC